jgi:hypothetical protein
LGGWLVWLVVDIDIVDRVVDDVSSSPVIQLTDAKHKSFSIVTANSSKQQRRRQIGILYYKEKPVVQREAKWS